MRVGREYSVPERLGGFGAGVAAAAALWPGFTAHTGLGVPCPLRWLTGVPCPGCGLTTAAVDLVHGRVGDSLAANPAIVGLAVLTVVTVPLAVLRRAGVLAPPVPWSPRARRRTELAMLAAAAASWVFQLHRFGFV
ncbi:DUF2752 domain-containing protein [Dactylosporangium sucinum]|uniref:DUF2752 domain-containing protein n=1 Tax=Dactylosporangium sucinum TaxID=1424081 RepID=A0A917TMR6_9ACTN|nr:DUF2752 domain-containing protein [Dactylosporangium sucinum]GGM29263.1 hypothetical protein GCM10007977_033170 [Dactylosporangium sucinum]